MDDVAIHIAQMLEVIFDKKVFLMFI
jgi:hypothetical protein